MRSELPRSPSGPFFEGLDPVRRDAFCDTWPSCGCLRDCEATQPPPHPRGFWIALAFACAAPVAYAACLFLLHFRSFP